MAEKSYRNIRPSFGESSKSGQGLADASVDGGRASPDPRRKTSDAPKHRKVPDSVTRNACLNCKRARAKCDGKTPCKRCATRAEAHECIYEIHLKHAKEDLVKQIKELQAKDALSQRILQALATKTKVPEVLEMLSNGDSTEAIARSLEDALPITTTSTSTSPTISFADIDHKPRSPDLGISRWTSVTDDKAILDHLFQLYFAWVHPVHTLFHEGQFVHSYQNGIHEEAGYCSSLLVNALCAMACHLHLHLESDTVDFRELGKEFADAVRTEMSDDVFRLSTIQAFAAMFLVEITRGNALLATSYLEIAVRGLSMVDPQTRTNAHDVWKCTVWGIQELNVEWAQMTFRVPYTIDLSYVRDNTAEDERLDLTRWYIYSTPSGLVNSWPSLQATTMRQKAKLIAIVHDMTTTLYSDHMPPISARTILDLYKRFVLWREEFATILVNVETNNNGGGLPHILSLLILYSSAVVQLLQPTMTLDGFPTHLVEDIIWTHAQQGFAFVGNQYKSQFPLRCQSVLQMYSMIHFADVIARFFPGGIEGYSTDGPQAIKTGIDILEESIHSAPVAAIMQEMLRRTAQACSIRLSTVHTVIGSSEKGVTKKYILDDFIKACTRPNFTQPLTEVSQRYATSFSDDWLAESMVRTMSDSPWSGNSSSTPGGTESSTQGLMHIKNLLN